MRPSLVLLVALYGSNWLGAQEVDEQAGFRSSVAPILLEHCVACHGAKKSEGGYRLDSFAELTKPGDSGQSPLMAQQPDASLLLQRMTADDPSERMPPDSDPLDAESIQKVSQWIASGAKYDADDASQLLSAIIPPPVYPPPPDSYGPVPIAALTFSPDGKHAICAGYHELTIWDCATGQLLRRISNLPERIMALAFTSDQSLLAVAGGQPGRSGEVRMVDWASGVVVGVPVRLSDVVLDVVIRPGRDEIGVAAADGSVRIVNFHTLELQNAYASHADWVTAIAISDDGQRLVSASRDKTAKVFDLDAGQMISSYSGHASPVRGIALTPDGAHVLSVGEDRKLHRWNAADGSRVADVALPSAGFHVARGDGFVLIPCATGQVVKLDLKDNQIAAKLEGHADWATSVAVNIAAGHVLSGGFDGRVRLWSIDGTLLNHWLAIPGGESSLSTDAAQASKQ
ncbi:MAG: hypothetical protein KF752_02260 [Pirellulaceae bacterium]|nr:hypothetical protein [Pirellulaceae bacterium]